MAGEWRERSFGELTRNFDGTRVPVKESDRRPGPYPYYGASGIVDYVDAYLFDGEYLLVAEDGENLRTRATPVVFMAHGQFWVNNHAHIVRGNDDADTRFLMYSLAANDISGYLTGSTMPKLTQGNMNRIPVLAPSLAEQRAIAHILGTLDDKIELNRRTSETLEAMARALFKSWFVDFDPVRAKLDGRWQRGQSLPGLPAHLCDIFPNRLADSELGETPEGWEAGTFGDVAEQLREQVNPAGSPESAFAHFSLPAFDAGQRPTIELGRDIKSNKWRVPPGSVLLSKLNPEIERVWLVDVDLADNAIGSTEFLVLAPRAPVTRSYVYCLARSVPFRQQMESLVTGTSKSHQRAQPSAVMESPIAIPPAPVFEAFDEAVANWLSKVLVNRRESRTLAALRDTLLPKLVSGDLRIKNAEKFIGDATT